MQRVDLNFETIVAAPAQAVWDHLTDWAGIMEWWPDDAPFPIIACTPVGEPGQLPFGRKVELPGGMTVLETLTLSDNTARRIYYEVANASFPGIRNYLASTVVDEFDAGKCRIRFASMFDFTADTDPGQSKAMILSVYQAIARGLERSLTKAG